MKRSTLLFTVSAFFVLFCFGLFFSFFSTHLPKHIPADFSVRVSEGGGEDPESIERTLKGTTVTVEHSFFNDLGQMQTTQETFTLTDAQVSVLYATLRSLRADQIVQTYDISDGDKAGYDLWWGDMHVSVWGMAVTDSDRDRYAEIYQLLLNSLSN